MMKAGIIAIVLALAALGLAGFATFAALDDDNPTPTAPVATIWSQRDCGMLRGVVPMAEITCLSGGECQSLVDLLQAINDNCP